ncbi:AAA family ATPase [Streptomyces sp. NBC_01497]|uniref:AAA family ATPase n=1 Tax=Streptomyces sp. NBC_01497 TaxID=2903885 RepID=UPI002E32132F|nr:LuxR C-terminal-related transcriptional regulator [Streptomyces sp. NBC_01497]
MRPVVPDFKLRPPTQPPHVLPRPRLLRRLGAATEALIVVSGPPGAGKTALLTEWTRDLIARGDCAWLGLDAHENPPGRLWGAVLHALRRIRPDLTAATSAQRWTLDGWIEELLPTLVAELAVSAGRAPLTLVLDGLEAVTDPESCRTLGDFLTRLPGGVRVVLATRHVPGAPVPALRAHGLVAELGPADLAFTREETRVLLTGLFGHAPGADVLDEVYAATAGWAAGLCLTGRALAGADGSPAGEPERAERAERAVGEYLATEVLDRLTTAQRDFLLRGSVLDELSAASCQVVTGTDQAGVTLREVARTVQLLVPVGAGAGAYRHHPALRSALRAMLAAEQPTAAASLGLAAARWYRARRDTTPAVRYSVLAGDPSLAIEAVLDVWEETIASGRSAVVAQWLRLLPARTIAADARLCVVAAMTELAGGNADLAQRWLDVAQARQAGAAEPGRAGTQGLGEDGTVAGAAAVARAIACCLRGEILSADRLSGTAAPAAAPLTAWRALACVARGTALLWQGRYDEADHWLGESVRDAHAAQHWLVLVRALGARAVCAHLSGRREQARALSDEALDRATAEGLGGHFVTALAHLGRARLLLGTATVEECAASLVHAEEALARTAPSGGDPHARVLCHLLREQLEEARHDDGAAREARGAAVRAAGSCASPGVLRDLLARPLSLSSAQPLTRPEERSGATDTPAVPPGPQELSAGERRILRALCGPLTLREIAAELYVSHNTVKTQVRSVFRKLGAHTRGGAVARARECGVLPPGPCTAYEASCRRA